MALLNSFFKIIAVCQVLSITNLLAYNASGAEKKSAFFGPNLPLASGKIRLSGPLGRQEPKVEQLEMVLLNSFFKIIAVCQVLSITNLLAYNASGAEKKSAFFGPNLPLASGKIRLSGPLGRQEPKVEQLEMVLLNSFFKIIAVCQVLEAGGCLKTHYYT